MESQDQPNNEGTIHWTTEIEEYFASTGEKAHCLSWLHKRSEELFANRRTYIDLPVIVLSSVIGFCSVGSSTLFSGNEQLASIVLGSSSLFVSMLNTMGSYFGWAKRGEGHRISAIHYAKLYRFLCVELRLPRDERMSVNSLLKYVKEKYDSLAETSPLTPEIIIRQFNKKFNGREYDNVSKPEEANGLEKITVYTGPSFRNSSPMRSRYSGVSSTPPRSITRNPSMIDSSAFSTSNPMYRPEEVEIGVLDDKADDKASISSSSELEPMKTDAVSPDKEKP